MQTLFHKNPYRQRIANGHSCMVCIHTKPEYQMMTPDSKQRRERHVAAHRGNLDRGLCLRGVPACNFTQDTEAAVALLCRTCKQLSGIPLQQSCPSTGPTLPESGVIALTMVLEVT